MAERDPLLAWPDGPEAPAALAEAWRRAVVIDASYIDPDEAPEGSQCAHGDGRCFIAWITVWDNAMLMVCCQHGQQLSYYQGRSQEAYDRTLRDRGEVPIIRRSWPDGIAP